MEENNLLEKFYNEQFKNKYDPDFHDLDVEYKKVLSKTLHFASYKLNYYFRQLITPLFDKLGLKLK